MSLLTDGADRTYPDRNETSRAVIGMPHLKTNLYVTIADPQPSTHAEIHGLLSNQRSASTFRWVLPLRLFRDLHATDKQVWLVSRRSLGSINMAANESRSSQNVNPEPLPCVTFWKQLFVHEII